MLLFSRNKAVGVQTFLLKLVNNHCPDLTPLFDNRRDESRVPVCVVTLVVPMKNGKPQPEGCFAAVTREFSTTGVSIVLDQPRGLDEVILAFRWEDQMVYLKGEAMHLNPMGAGFYHLGIRLSTVVRVDEYPELEDLRI
ncbi:MAG: hypothetical protein GXX96_11065 [Planctomycetaceae bacterium]|nr:hypothetical protein [Planctomycetaceae bacterium]